MIPEEVRAYITLSGDHSVEDQDPRAQLAKICLQAKKASPFEFYHSLQIKYKTMFAAVGFGWRNGKKRGSKTNLSHQADVKRIKADAKLENADHPIRRFIEHLKPEEVEACIW